MNRVRLCVVCVTLAISYVHAEPVSSQRLARVISTAEAITLNAYVPQELFSLQQVLKHRLPLQPQVLRRGKVETHNRSIQGLVRPLFVIGSDELSLSWLKTHKHTLMAQQAVGVLIEVPNLEVLQHVASVVDPLPLSLGNEMLLVEGLHITHYPVFVHAKGIEQ